MASSSADPARRAHAGATAAAESELVVRGGELALRLPRAGDAKALYALARDPQVTRFLSWGPYRRQDEAAAWLSSLPARRESGEGLELAIEHSGHGVVGITLVSEVSARDRRCVIGTWLGREHWGKGINRAAKGLLTHLLFGSLGMERVGAYADVRHARSQRALQSLGFRREGTLRAFHRHRDEPRDVHVFSLLRDEWQRSPLVAVDVEIEGCPPEQFSAWPR